MVGAVAGNSVIILVGLTIVGVELAESSVEVKGVRAITIGLAKVLVEFIVVNWKHRIG